MCSGSAIQPCLNCGFDKTAAVAPAIPSKFQTEQKVEVESVSVPFFQENKFSLESPVRDLLDRNGPHILPAAKKTRQSLNRTEINFKIQSLGLGSSGDIGATVTGWWKE